jgi:exodeoxyribonuclease-1
MNDKSFFFYDLETSGVNQARDRIMQFAGQRTTLDLEPIGEPINVFVKLSDDILPSPMAIKITGITPQQTRRDGLSEPEFLELLDREVFTPGTILTGYNSVRFDNLFLRFTRYRNFYDPYEWSWKDDRSYWDLLDVTRLIRALRPERIIWPFKEDGGVVNTLELLAKANGLLQTRAHDALSDVTALIDLARLLRDRQPRTFNYLLNLRTKNSVAKFIDEAANEPFIYTSGSYPIIQLHTTAVVIIGRKSDNSAVFVYDLRNDPDDYASITDDKLADSRFATRAMRAADHYLPFPAQILTFNQCPAIAPLSVYTSDPATHIGINLSPERITRNLAKLRDSEIGKRLSAILGAEREFPKATDAENALYEGFFGDEDRRQMEHVRNAKPVDFLDMAPHFKDVRLTELFMHYKARNHPDALSDGEVRAWEEYRAQRLNVDVLEFAAELERIAASATPGELSLMTDLRLWAESIMPLPMNDEPVKESLDLA